MKKYFFPVLLFLATTINLFSQGFTWERYTTKDGLYLNEMSQITQDDQGYLWIKDGNCLTRFDGKDFTNFIDKSNYMVMRNITMIRPKKDGSIHFNAALFSGTLNPKSDQFSYTTSDSTLSFQYYPKYEAYMYFDNYIDKNDYKIFGRCRGKNSDLKNDTLFYEYKNRLKWTLLPKHLKRDKQFLFTDKQFNVWIRMTDTVKSIEHYYLFENGNTSFICSSKIKSKRIIKDKINNYWLLGDSIIECYKDQKRILSFNSPSGEDFSGSDPLIDSKNNIWISNKTGLIKINSTAINFFKDKNRHVPETTVSYYQKGKEIQERRKKFTQYFDAFAIDKYDNVISGERIFDGHQFSNISFEKEFTNLFENTKKENLVQLNSCFVDAESNIWYGTNIGLFKASPLPFKLTDQTLSYEESDYKLESTNSHSLKLFQKEDLQNRKLYIKILSKESTVFNSEYKIPNEDYNGIEGRPFLGGFIFQFRDQNQTANLMYFDGKTTQSIKCEGKRSWFNHLLTKNDSCYFLDGDNFVVVTKNSISKFNAPSLASRISFGSTHHLNRLLLSNMYEVHFNQKHGIDTSLFSCGTDLTSYFFRRSQNDHETVLAYNNSSFILMDKGQCTKLKIAFDDSLTKILRMGFAEGFYFEDVFITSNYKNGYHLFLIDKVKKEARFLRKINFSDGLIDFYYNYFFYEKGHVIMYNENSETFKVINYKDLIEKGVPESLTYRSYLWLFDRVSEKNEFGQNTIGGYVSYIGDRGFNSQPPLLAINYFHFVYDNIVMEIDLNNDSAKKNIQIPSNFNPLTIQFKAVCLADGKKVKYKYRLIGLDKDWLPEWDHTLSDVTYPTLPPGSYTFQIIASNNNGIWTEKPAEISFEILPPWNRTWWAYCMYVVAGFAAIRGYLKNRTKKLEKEKEKLEKTVSERTAEVVAQKHLIEEKNKEVMDSITYARRIQRSLMPTEKYISRILGKKK